MKVQLRFSFLLIGIYAGLSSFAYAETELKSATGGAPPRKQTVDFEDELVEGELKKPELFYLLQKKQFNYKRLIKLRENFLPEMARDAEKVPSGRGQ